MILLPGAAEQLAQAACIALDGDLGALNTFTGVLDTFDPNFNIVTP